MVVFHHRRAGNCELDVGRVPRPADRDADQGHPLRNPLVQAGYHLAGRIARRAAGHGRVREPLRAGVQRRRVHHQPARSRPARRAGLGSVRLRGCPARGRARRPGPAAGPAPVLLEERQVGARASAPRHRRARLLGELRLPHLRRPMAGTAVHGRLTWETATVGAVTPETASTVTLSLSVPDWAGHRAGQHVDIRLTADDGYQAERAYSVASAPGEPLAITVERLDDGEVSPYLTEEARPGDQLEVRGPIGGYFVWEAETGGPLLLAAGGSGVVPLRAILRHRSLVGSSVPVRLLYSSRSWEDVIYSSELDRPAYGVKVIHTLTRSQPPKWHGYARRVDQQMLTEVAWPAADRPLAYVCGPTSFVESVAAGLVGLGYPAGRVKTERFGATGQ